VADLEPTEPIVEPTPEPEPVPEPEPEPIPEPEPEPAPVPAEPTSQVAEPPAPVPISGGAHFIQVGEPAPIVESPALVEPVLFYCLDPGHSPTYKHESRFFGYEGTGAPICPVCNKQVSAVPVSSLEDYPAIALRFS
jgi:hypothetical protein